MTSTNPRPASATAAAALGVLVLLLIVLPAAVSLASGKGRVCFSDSACPLSAVNPCARKPSFAVVGRCEVDLR